MSNILLSVITPTKNSAGTIVRFLSHLPFSHRSLFQIVIVDCLSTDQTLKLIKDFSCGLNQIVVSESDSGIYDAMNKGSKISLGKYLIFLNSDDWFDTTSFKSLFDNLLSESHPMYIFQQKRWVTNSKFILDSPVLAQTLYSTIPHQCVIISRDLFIQLGAFDLKYKICADYDLLLRAYLNGIDCKKIEIPLVNFSTDGFSSKVQSVPTYYTDVLKIWRKYNLIDLPKVINFTLKSALLAPKILFYSLMKRRFKNNLFT
jgi:glycosyltransferase involved in cell wall biosynthesis